MGGQVGRASGNPSSGRRTAILVGMDLQALLDDLLRETSPLARDGRVADYIPALARVGLAGTLAARALWVSITWAISVASSVTDGPRGPAAWSSSGRGSH